MALQDSIVLYFFLGFMALFGLIIFLAFFFEKRRREALQQAAQSIGFSFAGKPAGNELPQLANLNLFNQGHSRKLYNLMQGSRSSFSVAVFDYKYTIGGGKNSHTYNQTVVYVKLASSLPKFYLGPENFLHRIGDLFGFKDIDFDDYPNFSNNYLLKGDNEAAVRALFKPEIITFFENQQKGIVLEAEGNNLIFYRLSFRISANQINSTIDEALQFAKLFDKEEF